MNILIRNWLISVLLLSFSMLNAQTGIGTTTPNASAKLDVYATNKGFLPPRVTLTSTTDATTIASPAEGLLVYNLGSVGLQAGYYYWNGASWATIATATSAGNGVTAMNMVSLYGKAYSAASGDIAHTNGYTFTVPLSGRYLFDFSSSGYMNQATMAITFKVRQGTTDLGTDVFSNANNNVHVVFTGKVEVNLQAGVTYNVNVTSTGSRDAGDYDRVFYKLVAGNLPVTGQSVDYLQASLSANQTLSAAGNIIFNTSSGTGITITSGGFDLKANKTYKLEAALGGSSTGYGYYTWVDNTNALLPGGSIGVIMKAGAAFTDAPQDKAVVFYTPSANTTVYLRVINVSGTVTAYAPSSASGYSSSWASIQQVGSSAFVNPWILSGNDVYNNTGKVGIGTTTPASTLDVNGSANATTLNLTNSTIGTPSLILRNGDAATSYSDVAQIKMGWSGSATGKSQYAQFIHSRHNSGPTNNAIDFYLSDGTADNTVATGSTKAMSLESPGNLTVAGKINLADASGNVAIKAAAFVNESVPVTLGDIQVQMAPNGLARSLQIKTTGTAFTGMVSAYTTYNGASGSHAFTYISDVTQNINTTFAHLGTTWGFAQSGDVANYFLRDSTNSRFYRITLMVGPSYFNNFISIERLL